MKEWPKSNNPDTPGRAERQKNRIAIQLVGHEKRAIEWLSRCPDGVELAKPFVALRRCPARIIAKTLSGKQIASLAKIYARQNPEAKPEPPPC